MKRRGIIICFVLLWAAWAGSTAAYHVEIREARAEAERLRKEVETMRAQIKALEQRTKNPLYERTDDDGD